jgi:hypothetical protein
MTTDLYNALRKNLNTTAFSSLYNQHVEIVSVYYTTGKYAGELLVKAKLPDHDEPIIFWPDELTGYVYPIAGEDYSMEANLHV